MTRHYPDLGSASDWLNIFFIQIEEGVLFIDFFYQKQHSDLGSEALANLRSGTIFVSLCK